MKPTSFRKKLMAAGDVFAGIKTKDTNTRRRIESERHCIFMDMQGSEANVAAGAPAKINPCKWLDSYVKAHGVVHTEAYLKNILKEITKPEDREDKLVKPYIQSGMAKKNVVFYENAFGYFRNKYLKGQG